jgi:peptidoglycan L-alanyl-D-glutamate endopeptidase CwlK
MLTDKPMVLMALSTIRAETEGFEPIPEGRSRFNTSPTGHPFDLYDKRHDLGNLGAPDGERFRGRGFIQLTGRFNYQKFGPVTDIAAKLLAAFLKDKEQRIKEALLENDLRQARRLVNGGTTGVDRFSDAFTIGQRLLA